MKKSDDTVRMLHMLDAARDAIEFLGSESLDTLKSDKKLGYSIIRSLEIIGEAAANVSDDTRVKYPEIEWAVITGMRNRLVHAYFDINYNIVWQTVKENLPSLIEKLEKILQDME